MKALELAAYVVNKCINDPNLGITNLQLQKILYFLQIRSLKEDPNQAIISDTFFRAWKFGPVLTNVYYSYCFNGGLKIDCPVLGDASNAIPNSNEVPYYVNNLVEQALKARPWKLVELSHRDGGAWKKAFEKGLNSVIAMDDMIKESRSFDENSFLEE